MGRAERGGDSISFTGGGKDEYGEVWREREDRSRVRQDGT